MGFILFICKVVVLIRLLFFGGSILLVGGSRKGIEWLGGCDVSFLF